VVEMMIKQAIFKKKEKVQANDKQLLTIGVIDDGDSDDDNIFVSKLISTTLTNKKGKTKYQVKKWHNNYC
jgi:hypothetical protein